MDEKRILKNVPEKLKWNNQIYYFICNKGKTLLYSARNDHESYCIGNNEIIIIEHRKHMKSYDKFYVLYHLNSYNDGEGTGINVNKLDSVNRLAQII